MYPTVDEIFSVAPAAGGRPTLVLQETLYIMKRFLPDVLTRVNERENLSIPLPANYGFSGSAMGNKYPILTVGISNTRNELGLRVNEDFNDVTVNYLYDLIATPRQVLDAIEACTWIGNIMHRFVGTHCNTAGRRIWNQLQPRGIVPVSYERSNAEGFAFQFRAWQPGQGSSSQYWSQSLIEP